MRIARAWTAALVATLVAGCSGGGRKGNDGGERPVADAGQDATVRLHRPHMLDGTGSADPEGKALAYEWTIVSAPDGSTAALDDPTLPSPALVPDVPGDYVVALVVSDGKKASAIDTVELHATLRVAVFADLFGTLASELALRGVGDVDDYTATPDTYPISASGTYVLLRDERIHVPTLLSHRTADGFQETLAVGEIGAAMTDGRFAVWLERRNGRWDLFVRDLETGVETQLTDSAQVEELGDIHDHVITWAETRDPAYLRDVFAYDMDSGVEVLVAGDFEDERGPSTDGRIVAYTRAGASADVYLFDLADQSSLPVASTSGDEIAAGVANDGTSSHVVYVELTTGGASAIGKASYQTGALTPPVTVYPDHGAPLLAEGPWLVFADLSTQELLFHPLAGSGATVVTDTWTAFDLEGDRLVWRDPTGAGGGDVVSRMLPGGADTPVVAASTAADERHVKVNADGVIWAAPAANGVLESYVSYDGTAAQLLSGGKTFLGDVLDDYDVALVGGDLQGEYAVQVVGALDAAGVPILAAEASGFGLADRWQADALYGLESESAINCAPISIALDASAHPAFAGFPAGALVTLEDGGGTDAPWFAQSADVSGVDAPADWLVLARFATSMCEVANDPALATFTTDNGTRVLLDGAANDAYNYVFWNVNRVRLLESELLWLASTKGAGYRAQ